MKRLPDLTIVPDKLFDMQFGVVRGHILMSAVDLEVFSHTIEPTTSNDVAGVIGTDPENTELFLTALASIGLLEKKDGVFRNTALTDAFLVKGRETFLGDYLECTQSFLFKNADEMKAAIVNGPAAQEQWDADEEAQYNSTVLMSSIARSGTSQAVANAIAELPEFGRFAKMLDLGGGHGLDSMATVQMHPSMEGVIFDKMAAVRAAREMIHEYGMEDRMTVLCGDYLADDIGSGYDLILAKGTLNFAGPGLESVVQKVFGALNEGGVFVSIHDGLTHERTMPEAMVVGWLPFGLSVMDVSLARERIPDAMTAAGFSRLELSPHHSPLGGEFDMIVGRKGVAEAGLRDHFSGRESMTSHGSLMP